MSDPHDEIAKLIADAIEHRQIEPLLARLAPDAVVWHNSDRLDTDCAATFAAVAAGPTNFTITMHNVLPTPSGVVLQFVMGIDGESSFELHNCMVVSVEDGLITRMDEYLDPAVLAMFPTA